MNLLRKIYNKLQVEIAKVVNRAYEWYIRKRLKNQDFTILCSNCIGGIIYHRLGLQFRSPTVNLWMHQRDFLKLVTNLHKFDAQLQFIGSDYDYPVAMLDDITIHFNHSKSNEAARADWNRRVARINYDNLFLIMYDREDITEADIRSLDRIPCRGKLVLSDKEYPDIPYVKTMKPSTQLHGSQCLDLDWFGLRTFEKHFDYVRWLNQN